MSKINLSKLFLFEWDKVKLFFVIDIRVIVKFLFKKYFLKIKSNFEDNFPKRSSRVLKNFIKKDLYTLKYISYCVFSISHQ